MDKIMTTIITMILVATVITGAILMSEINSTDWKSGVESIQGGK